GFAVVGRVGSAVEATRMLRDQPLDMVLVESTLPEPGAVEMARFFRVRQPKTVVVFVTRAFSQTELFEAARVGAAAYLRASTDADLFAATLRRAAAGQFPIDEEVVRFPAVAARILAQFREESVAEAAQAPAPEAAPRKAAENRPEGLDTLAACLGQTSQKFGRLRLAPKTGLSAELLGGPFGSRRGYPGMAWFLQPSVCLYRRRVGRAAANRA